MHPTLLKEMVAEGDPVELGPAMEQLELPPDFKLSSMIDCGGLVQMVQQLMLALQKQTARSDALEATVANMQEEMLADREFVERLNCHIAAQAAIQMSNGALLDEYRDDIESEIAIPGEFTAEDSTDEIVAVKQPADSLPAVKAPTVSVKAPDVVTTPVKRPPSTRSPQQLLHPLRTFSTTPAGVSSEAHDKLIERVAALEVTSLEPGQWKQLAERVNDLEEVKPQILSRLDALEKGQQEHSHALAELNTKLTEISNFDFQKLQEHVDSVSDRMKAVELLKSELRALQMQFDEKVERDAEAYKLLDATVTALADRVGMLETGISNTGEHLAAMIAPALDLVTKIECGINLIPDSSYCVDRLDCSLAGLWKLLWHTVSKLRSDADKMHDSFTGLNLAEELATLKDDLFQKADIESFAPLKETDQLLTSAVDMLRTELARLSVCLETKATTYQLQELATNKTVNKLEEKYKNCGQRNELEILWARVHSFEETLKEFTDLIANGAQGDGEERDLAALFRFPIRCLSCNSQSSPPIRRPSPPREAMGVDNKPYKTRGIGNTVGVGSDAMWNVLGNRPQSARERSGVSTAGFPRGRKQVFKGPPPAHLKSSPHLSQSPTTRPSSARTVSVATVLEESPGIKQTQMNVPSVRGPTLANMQRLLDDANVPRVEGGGLVVKKPAFS